MKSAGSGDFTALRKKPVRAERIWNMLVDLNRTATYICPYCSSISSKDISVFAFSGKGKLRLVCPTRNCGETCVTVSRTKRGYQIDLECVVCAGIHTYTVSAQRFWHGKLQRYKCAMSGIDVFFIGEKERIGSYLKDNPEIYENMDDIAALGGGYGDDNIGDLIDDLEDAIDDDYDTAFDDDDYDDGPFALLFAIIDRLNVLKENSGVACRCGGTEIELSVVRGNVILSCPVCKRSKVLQTSEDTLSELLEARAVVI